MHWIRNDRDSIAVAAFVGVVGVIGIGLCGAPAPAAAEDVDPNTLSDVDRQAYDLLVERCADCHSAFSFEDNGGFTQLLDFDALFTNAVASAVGRGSIDCAQQERSKILTMVAPGFDGAAPKMPKGAYDSLNSDEITLLTEWIAQGCAARGLDAPAAPAAPLVVAGAPAETIAGAPADGGDLGVGDLGVGDLGAATASAPAPAIVDDPTVTQTTAPAPQPVRQAPAPDLAGRTPIEHAAFRALERHCVRCHDSGNNNNGGFTHVLDLAYLAAGRGPKPYVDACRPEESLLLRQIVNGAMPKDGAIIHDPAQAEDVAAIRAWLHSLNGEAQRETLRPDRTFVRAETIRDAALRDAARAPPGEARHYRYISLATLYNTNATDSELEIYRRAVGKLINALSRAPRVVAPTVVADSNGLLLRLDLRDYAWTAGKWALLESAYEYAVEPFQSGAHASLQTITGAREPIIRADWFAFKASRPPLYHDLLGLPDTEQALEAQLGIDTADNLLNYRVARIGFGPRESGVSFNARLIERHDLPGGGTYWKSYDFGGRSAVENLEETPFGPIPMRELPDAPVFSHDGGEIIFSLPNGLHGYFLATDAGERINVGPPQIVHDSSRDDHQIINGLSCMSCHSAGMQIKFDSIRDGLMAEGGAGALRDPRARAVFDRLHPDNDEVLRLFHMDEQAFLQALSPLGLAQPGPGGRLVPVYAPNRLEPVRALSDRYEEAMSLLRLAAEMDMTVDAFSAAARGTQAMSLIGAPCDRLPRETFEQRFADLLPLVSVDRPAERAPVRAVARAAQVNPAAYVEAVQDVAGDTQAGDAAEAGDRRAVGQQPYQAAAPDVREVGDPINVTLEVPQTEFQIGDQFHFFITAEQDCNFVVFTIDSAGQVELHNPATPGNQRVLGAPLLQAGERRRIPAQGFAAEVEPPAGRLRIGAICGIEALQEMGIEEYILRRPRALGEDKGIGFVTVETRDRFNSDALDAVLVDVTVTE